MKKANKALVTFAIVAMALSTLPMQAFANLTFPSRLSGTTQYDTAAQIAEQGWAHGSNSAVLAAGMTGHTLVDALAAGPLASVLNIPIILTEGTALTPAASTELTKLCVTRVYVTSGKAVIRQPVLDALNALGIQIIALGGFDAAETSINIAKEIAKTVPITGIVLAGGYGADALSVASIAGAKKMPILYTDNAAGLPTSIQSYLSGLSSISASYVIGGTAVVSDAEKNQLPGTPIRYSGSTAYDTNQAVIQGFNKDFNFSNVFVANGTTLVDALAGAPLAAAKNAAIVLTNGTFITAASHINNKLSPSTVVTALGGVTVVPNTVLATLGYGIVPPPGTEDTNPQPGSSYAPLIVYPKNNEAVYPYKPIIVKWTEVLNAESYVVTLTNGSSLILNEIVSQTNYAIPQGPVLDGNLILRVAAKVQGSEYWSQSIQIYINHFDPSASSVSFDINSLPENIESGKNLVLNWGCTGITGQTSSPIGIIDNLRLTILDLNDNYSSKPLILDTWLDARVTTYTVPASLFTVGHHYEVGLVGINTTDPQDPNIFEFRPRNSNPRFSVNLNDLNFQLGSPLGPVIIYPSSPYIGAHNLAIRWNSVPGATMYSCEIDDLTDKRIIQNVNAIEPEITFSSDVVGNRYHLYRIRISATMNGQKIWGPSKTVENLELFRIIPQIILPVSDNHIYPQQNLQISWTNPDLSNFLLNGQPVYKLEMKDNASENVVLSTVVTGTSSYTIDKSLLLLSHQYTLAIVIASGTDESDPNYFDTSSSPSNCGIIISN